MECFKAQGHLIEYYKQRAFMREPRQTSFGKEGLPVRGELRPGISPGGVRPGVRGACNCQSDHRGNEDE